jgi:hypothetical protein
MTSSMERDKDRPQLRMDFMSVYSEMIPSPRESMQDRGAATLLSGGTVAASRPLASNIRASVGRTEALARSVSSHEQARSRRSRVGTWSKTEQQIGVS